MSYQPQFTITPKLSFLVEQISALRERIEGATVALSWIPNLRKDTRIRNGHASRVIEGNPLTLEQVRALSQVREAGEDLTEWLEYSTKGLRITLERVWLRLQKFQAASSDKITLTSRQEHLLGLLRDHGS